MRISKKRDFECWVSKKYLFLNGFFFLLFFSTSFIIGTNALAANRATGTWYYCQLSQGGNDGSSCDNCLSMAQFAADTFSAPNTAVFCNNGGNITSQVTLPSSGTAGNIITYRGDATNPPTFTSAAQTAHMNCRSYVTLGPYITMSGTGYGVNATCYAASPTDQTITGVTITSGTFPILADVAAAGTLNNFTVSNVVASGQTQSMQLGGGATGRGTLTFTNNTIDASSIAAGYAVQLRQFTGMSASGNVITNTQVGLTAGVYLLDIAGTWNYTFPTNVVGIGGSSVTGLYVDSVLGTGTISGTLGQTTISGTQSAVFISNTNPTSLTVSNMTVDGATKAGGAAFTAQCSGVGTTQNVIFTGNTAKNGLSTATIDGFMVNSSAAGCTVQNITFTGNTSEGNGCDGFSGYASGITDNITYTNNIARNNGTNEANSNCGDGFTFHNTCSNIKMNYNLAYGNRVSGFAHVGTSNGMMYNNTIYNNGGDKNSDGVSWGTRGARGCLYLDLTAAAANSWKFKNNICAQNAPWEIKVDADGWNSLDINNNDYIHDESWATEAKFATLDSGVSDLTKAQYLVSEGGSYETSSKYSDPLFQGSYNFRLQPSSSAIDLGVNVYLTSDYLGNNMYGLPDAGAYEYRPVYTIAAYSVPITGSVRLYSDGKYRMVTASSSAAVADFSITPVGGNFYATTTQYMDISIDTWQTAGDKNKAWTVTSTAGSFKTHATSTVYTVGDLLPDTYYTFKLDGSASSTAITGSNCSGSVCLSDGTGNTTFTYVGGYSTHTFELNNATTCTFESHGTNDWNTALNWSCAMVPTSTTIVIIPSSTTTQLSVDSEVGNVTIGTGSTLDLNNRTLNIINDWTDNGTLVPGTGSVVFSGDGDQTIGAEANFYDLTINKSSGTATLTGSVTSTHDVTLTVGTLVLGANRLSIGRNYSNVGGTLTEAGSTVEFNGSGAQTISAETFNNVVIRKSAETATLTGTVTIGGTLTTTGGAGTLSAAGQTLTVTGISTIGSGTTVTSTSGTLTFTGAVTNAGSIGSSTGNKLFSSTLASTGTLSVGSGYTTTTGAFTGAGTIQNNSGMLVVNSHLTGFTTYTRGTGTLRLFGATDQNITGGAFYNLETLKGSGTATIITNNATVAGTLVTRGAGTLSSAALNLTVSGTTNNGGDSTVTSTSGTLAFAGVTNAGNLGSNSGSITMTSLTNSGTVALGGTSTSTGTVTNSGTLDLNGKTLNVGGNWSDSGTFTPAEGTIEFDGSGAQSIGTEAGFYNLRIFNTNTATLTGHVTTTNFAVGAGGTLAVASKILYAPGTYTNLGTVSRTTGKIKHTAESYNWVNGAGVTQTNYDVPTNSYLRVQDANRNMDGTVAETIAVPVSLDGTSGSDTENITLTETGVATGIFMSSAIGSFSTSIVHPYNGEIEVLRTGTGTGTYTDNQDSADTGSTTATVTYTPASSGTGGGGGGGGSLAVTTKTETVFNDPNRQAYIANLSSMNLPIHSLVKLPDDGNAKTQEDTAVYYVGNDGKRHAFPNSKVFFTWYSNFDGVTVITPSQMASIPLGTNVRYKPGSRMVKFTTDPKVYAVDVNGTLRWVKTEDLAKGLYGDAWNTKIDDMSDAFFSNYVFGDEIKSQADFNLIKILSLEQFISDDFNMS